MPKDAPRYDTKSESYRTAFGLGPKEHKTTVRDNTSGKEYKGYSSTSEQKSRDNAFKKAKADE